MEKLVIVDFVGRHKQFHPGDCAGFTAAHAIALVNSGTAVFWGNDPATACKTNIGMSDIPVKAWSISPKEAFERQQAVASLAEKPSALDKMLRKG